MRRNRMLEEALVKIRDTAHALQDAKQKLAERDAWIEELEAKLAQGTRKRLPAERRSVCKTLRIGGKADGVSAHVHVGEYEDGRPGEVFITLGPCMDKSVPPENVDWRGLALRLSYLARTLADGLATDMSIALQYGVPISVMLAKHQHQQDVGGYTGDPEFPSAAGLLDYFAQWATKRYVEAPDGQ